MKQCFNCESDQIIWQNDFNFEDMGMEGDGIVQIYQCATCGARIDVAVPQESDKEGSEQCDYDCDHCEWATCPKMEVDR